MKESDKGRENEREDRDRKDEGGTEIERRKEGQT